MCRSFSWLSYRANPRHTNGSVTLPYLCWSRTNSSTRAPRATWWIDRWPVGEAAVVVLWLSQWNRQGPRARSR